VVGFPWFIPAFAGLACIAAFLKFRRIWNPVALLVAWWCLWLFVATLGPTGLYVPGIRTQILVLVMLSSLTAGSLVARSALDGAGSSSLEYNRNLRERWRWVSRAALASTPVVGYYFFKALSIFYSEGLLGYRDAVFGDPDRPSVLFGSNYLELLYTIVLSPVIFLLLLAGVVLYLACRERGMLCVSLLLLAMDAGMRLGRFNFYYFLFFLALSSLLLFQRSRMGDDVGMAFRSSLREARGAVAALMLAMMAFVAAISTVRDKDVGNFADVIGRAAIEYHTVGFVLFDDSVNNPSSGLNREAFYGRSLLGGLDTLAVLALRRLDNELQSVSNRNGPLMREFQVVGYDPDGIPLLYNAFYTVLYTLYQDGREFSFFLVPFLFGYFLSTRYLDWLKGGDLGTLMLLNALLYVGFFSLFQSPVEGIIFWISIILLFMINRARLPVRFVRPSRRA
jgi:oligosaccharide repeat unit polymerase